MITAIRHVILYACLSCLAAMGAVLLTVLFNKSARAVMSRLMFPSLAACLVMAFWCTYVGGSKRVIYPRTDASASYLVDRGSYVSNDVVHVDFTRLVVPASATFYLDYRPDGSTNDADYATAYSAAFSDFTLPLDVPFENATNYTWIAYTDWTPGPAIETNGVWHAIWGMTIPRTHILPVRTSVRVDGEVIATPKSKADAEEINE